MGDHVMQAKRHWVPIDDLMRDLGDTAKLLSAGRPVRFRVTCRLRGVGLLTDPFALRAALRTLIANAVKHTAAGEITLEVGKDAYAVRFSVRDTGPGIPHERHDSLFGPAGRFDAVFMRRLGEPDLGLPLCRQLLRELGGDLSFIAGRGGSTFTAAVPAVDRYGNELVQPLLGRPDFPSLRILAA